MFKFLRRNRQQPEQGPEQENRDHELGPEVDPLEEALTPLFETINPGSSEEYAVPVTEMERLWSRFQQLGPNEEGTLPSEAIQHASFVSDPLVKQIWRTFPRDDNGNLTFHSFVGVLMWWKTAPLEKKLEGIFKLLNKSQPLDVFALQQIIVKFDSSVDEETAKSKAELLVKTMDDKEQGYIDIDQWVKWILQLPKDEITKLTKFEVISGEMDSQLPNGTGAGLENESEISDEVLVDTAGKIGEKDWTPLARALGFNKQEIQDVKKKYPHRSREQVYQVLLLWRQTKGQEATVAALELSLRNSGLETQSRHSAIQA